MISAFLAWWWGRLSELLPAWAFRLDSTSADALLISPVGPIARAIEVRLTSRRKGEEQPLGVFAPGGDRLRHVQSAPDRPVVIRLTKSEFLEKRLVLPLPALTSLDQVLAFEMDRETPFAPDEVYWTRVIESVDRRRSQLQVRLILLPKAHARPLLEALAASGITPGWVEIEGDGPNRMMLPLSDDGVPPRDRSQRLVRPAYACCALLAIAAVALPFVRQSIQLATLSREVQAARSTAREAETLRADIDRLARGAALVHGEIAKTGRPLEILAALTQIIPDDTYLTEFDLRQRKLTLGGRSSGAARLIGALAADGRFHNPAFAAPVTRLEALHAEVFSIVAEVGPRP